MMRKPTFMKDISKVAAIKVMPAPSSILEFLESATGVDPLTRVFRHKALQQQQKVEFTTPLIAEDSPIPHVMGNSGTSNVFLDLCLLPANAKGASPMSVKLAKGKTSAPMWHQKQIFERKRDGYARPSTLPACKQWHCREADQTREVRRKETSLGFQAGVHIGHMTWEWLLKIEDPTGKTPWVGNLDRTVSYDSP
eukprot:1151864-Amphidinium_carterae.2